MNLTLIQLVNQVCDEVGYTRPATLVGSTNNDARQFLAQLLRACDSLRQAHDWQVLTVKGQITTTLGTISYPLPSDFQRFVNMTQWNTTQKVPLFGPSSIKDWATSTFGFVGTVPFYRFTRIQDQVNLKPAPAAVQTINFYYISSYYVVTPVAGAIAGATVFNPQNYVASQGFFSDSQQIIFPDELVIAGMKWRWLRAKGLSYDEERDDYDRLLIHYKGAERGGRTLSMDPLNSAFERQLGFIVPLTGFGQ